MVFQGERLMACVPAHVRQNAWYSHRGLTYGGIIISDYNADVFKELLSAVEYFLKQENITQAEFNLSPPCYHPYHDDMVRVFAAAGYEVQREHINMHAVLDETLVISSKKTAGYRNGKFDDLVFSTSAPIAEFYQQVLVPSLRSRFNTTPIHTLEELSRLQFIFPEQIVVHAVYDREEMIAGVLYFIKNSIAKSQYAASTALGFKTRAMDFLYQESLKYFKSMDVTALDYGTIHGADGSISDGMRRFKEELGARPTTVLRLEKTL